MKLSKLEKRVKRNATIKSKYKTQLKNTRKKFAQQPNLPHLQDLQRAARKAVAKKVIHKNKASRIVSRSMMKLNLISSSESQGQV